MTVSKDVGASLVACGAALRSCGRRTKKQTGSARLSDENRRD